MGGGDISQAPRLPVSAVLLNSSDRHQSTGAD